MRIIGYLICLTWTSFANGFGIAEMISNYAKVAVNNSNTTHKLKPIIFTNKSTIIPAGNKTKDDDDDDGVPEYDDFDDLNSPERSQQSTLFDSSSMLKYLNGVVNLLALMYQYSGKTTKTPSISLGKTKSKPTGRGSLAESINSFAEDRYQPSTAHKKFKLQQNYYNPVDTYPPYDPYSQSKAETYNAGGAGTSYDADASMYMMKNPVKGTMNDVKPSYMPMPEMNKVKSPMKDYMAQNEAVDVQQSYSYEVPDSPKKSKPPTMSDWSKNPPNDDDDHHNPLLYPWLSKVPGNDHIEDEPEPPMKSHPEEVEEEAPMKDMHFPVYYPWMSKSPPKKMKPMLSAPPPPHPPMDDDHHEDSDDGDDDDHPPWMTGSTSPKENDKGKDSHPPPDDHPPYYYWHSGHDHDHGYIDDTKDHDHFDHDHDMKDEDRESKRPYTYYHLGRKLWYVPLLFSMYFIVYIGALILKSIARHKVQFPEKLWELHKQEDHDHHDEHSRRGRKIDSTTEIVYSAIDKYKYM